MWPGIEGLHLGRHRQSPQPLHLLRAIRFCVNILLRSASLIGSGDGDGTLYGLACLAPLALGESVAMQCGSVVHCYEIRLMRVDALRVCRRYREASKELALLLRGEGLPLDVVDPAVQERAAAAAADADAMETETETTGLQKIVANVVKGRPGRETGGAGAKGGAGAAGGADGENDSSSPSKVNTARSSKGSPGSTKGDETGRTTGTGRSGAGVGGEGSKVSGPYDGETNEFLEYEYQEADAYELAEDSSRGESSPLPLLCNDVHLLHADNVQAVQWILNVDEIRSKKRIRLFVGRAMIRRLNLIRLEILIDMASIQPSSKSKSITFLSDMQGGEEITMETETMLHTVS